MRKKIFLSVNLIISIIIVLLVLGVLQGDDTIIGIRHTVVNIILLLVFIASGILNIYGLIKLKKIRIEKVAGVILSVVGTAMILYSINTGESIRKKMSNTIIYYSDKICFDIDSRCTVKIIGKLVSYNCKSGLVVTMSVESGAINKSYKKLSMITNFDSVYSEEVNETMIIQHQITPEKYINVLLKNNKRQIGSAPYKSCKSLVGPVTKTHIIEL